MDDLCLFLLLKARFLNRIKTCYSSNWYFPSIAHFKDEHKNNPDFLLIHYLWSLCLSVKVRNFLVPDVAKSWVFVFSSEVGVKHGLSWTKGSSGSLGDVQ